MKKWLKVVVSVLFAVCLCLAFAACEVHTIGPNNNSNSGSTSNSGSGSSSNSGNNQPKEDSDGTFIYSGASIKAANTSISGDIIIPASHNGTTIDTIPKDAFKGCTGITSITVPKEITSIGTGAFSGCSLLRSITLPFVGSTKGNTGENALFGYIFGEISYQGGTSVEQHYGTGIGQYNNHYIPTTLRSVTITNETILGYCAFEDLSMLTKIDLNDGILQIGVGCFQGCSKVEEISLPSITILPSSAFSGCISLKKFTINDSIDTISFNVFKGCSALSMVNSETAGTFIIPNTVTSIGRGAFNGCSMMKSITLPFVGSTKGNTGENALFGYIFGETSYQGGTSVEQHYGTGIGQYNNHYIPTTLRSVTITSETVISRGAFQNCSFLDTLTINSGAKNSMGTDAFKNATQPTWN